MQMPGKRQWCINSSSSSHAIEGWNYIQFYFLEVDKHSYRTVAIEWKKMTCVSADVDRRIEVENCAKCTMHVRLIGKFCATGRTCADRLLKFRSGWRNDEIYLGKALRYWMSKRRYSRLIFNILAYVYSETSTALQLKRNRSRRIRVKTEPHKEHGNNLCLFCIQSRSWWEVLSTLSPFDAAGGKLLLWLKNKEDFGRFYSQIISAWNAENRKYYT